MANVAVINHNGVNYTIDDPTVANVFLEDVDYPAGAYVKIGGGLRRFTTGHPAGPWIETDAVSVDVCSEIKNTKAEITDLNTALTSKKLFQLKESNGFVGADGNCTIAGTTYLFTYMIAVKTGDIYEYDLYGSNSVLAIAAYENVTDTTAIVSKSVAGRNATTGLYIVPDGINYVRITTNSDYSRPVFRLAIPHFAGNRIAHETNIDTILDGGVYCSVAGSFTSDDTLPFSSQVGVLIVYKEENLGFCYQTFIETYTGKLYTRFYSNGSWRSWGHSSVFTSAPLATGTDLDTLIEPGFYNCLAGAFSDASRPPCDDDVGILIVSKETSAGIIYQTFIESYTGKTFTRIKRSTGWDSWAYTTNEKTISILFVGNSLTQDGIAYLPYLLKHYYPEINFKFYMWYNGGRTLDEQYTFFTNNTPCDIFSVADNTDNWTNYNSSKTMSSILNTYNFDVVCMQDYFNYKDGYSTDSDMDAWKNCKDYITANYTGGNGLEFILLFHAPKRDTPQAIFTKELNSYKMLLQKTISDDMIANGIAVYRALSTELDNLGDQGHLSPDGTHTQEGLPCLLQTYTTACWLFDKLGIAKSVYGCPLRMNTTIYNSINVPGANLGSGVITGTDAQNLLAQEVAIEAYKEGKYYVQNNIFVPET